MAAQQAPKRLVSSRRHRSVCLDLPDSGAFRLALISDTHGRAHPASAVCVQAQSPDAILHGGDIGTPEVLEPFAELAPLYAVRGNIDPRGPDWLDSMDITLNRRGSRVLRVLLTHIALYGPKLRKDARLLALEYEASLVVCGHSHVPFIGRDRGISVINPGSIGPRRFGLPIVFALLDILPEGFAARHVDCETGSVWRP